MVMSPEGFGPEHDYHGEYQKQLKITDPSSRQRGCCIRIMTAGVQPKKKKLLAVSPKEIVAKTGHKPPVVKLIL
jgi:hypothetical protein